VLIAGGDVYFDGPATQIFATNRGGPGVISPGFAEIMTGSTFEIPDAEPTFLPGIMSHWHTKHQPNMIMEAQSFLGTDYSTLFQQDLVIPAFQDVGWEFNSVIFPADPVWPPLVPVAARVAKGSTSDTKQVVITNTQTGSISVSSIGVFGAHANDFTVLSGGSISTIPGRSSHTITIEFSPSMIGYRTADLDVNYNDGTGQTETIKLVGFGRGHRGEVFVIRQGLPIVQLVAP